MPLSTRGVRKRGTLCYLRWWRASKVRVTSRWGPYRCPKMVSEVRTRPKRRSAIEAQAKSDALQLLRAINATQAHGQEGARVDPARAAHEAGLDVGDVGSDRYHRALGYLLEEAALLGDEHTAFDVVGEGHPHGYALYFFTRRAVKLLEG